MKCDAMEREECGLLSPPSEKHGEQVQPQGIRFMKSTVFLGMLALACVVAGFAAGRSTAPTAEVEIQSEAVDSAGIVSEFLEDDEAGKNDEGDWPDAFFRKLMTRTRQTRSATRMT